jgi:antitoxin VapB
MEALQADIKESWKMVQKGRSRSLNVKDPKAHRLAEEIARETGETITGAVLEALRERRERLRQRRGRASVPELLGLACRISELCQGRPLDHGRLLYDGHGLPK